MATVPPIIGLPVEQALGVLISANLSGGVVGRQQDAAVREGCVLACSPFQGEPIADGGNVFLWESSGPGPSGLVPDVAGLTFQQAQTVLAGAGYSASEFPISDEVVPPGLVIRTAPAAGEALPVGIGIGVGVYTSTGPFPWEPDRPVDPVIIRDELAAKRAGGVLSDVCDLLRRAIDDLQAALLAQEAHAERLRALIASLRPGPDTDPEQIARLVAELEQVQSRIESDRGQLTGFQEEFSAECS